MDFGSLGMLLSYSFSSLTALVLLLKAGRRLGVFTLVLLDSFGVIPGSPRAFDGGPQALYKP